MLCHLALVEPPPPVPGDMAQCSREVRLAPGLPDFVGTAIRFEKEAQGLRVLPQALAAGLDFIVEGEGDRKAILCQGNGGGEYLFPAHAAIFLKGVEQACYRAGNPGGLVAEVGALAIHRAGFVEKQFAVRRRRRRLAVVDESLPVPVREMNEHEAAAPEIAGPGVRHRQGKAGGDRRVHGIAALLQDLQPDLRGQFLCSHDHTLPGDDRQEALLVIDDRRQLCLRVARPG
jgi:hypothetical protein